jgi:hypothetical protein
MLCLHNPSSSRTTPRLACSPSPWSNPSGSAVTPEPLELGAKSDVGLNQTPPRTSVPGKWSLSMRVVLLLLRCQYTRSAPEPCWLTGGRADHMISWSRRVKVYKLCYWIGSVSEVRYHKALALYINSISTLYKTDKIHVSRGTAEAKQFTTKRSDLSQWISNAKQTRLQVEISPAANFSSSSPSHQPRI